MIGKLLQILPATPPALEPKIFVTRMLMHDAAMYLHILIVHAAMTGRYHNEPL